MQPAVYFLNRMSEHAAYEKAKGWSVSQHRLQHRAERARTGSTRRVMNKSHSPWTFLWRHWGSDMELFHLIAPKCPGDVRNSDTCKWIYCICMRAVLCMCVNTSQPSGSHIRHLHSSSGDPCNIHSVFQRIFFLSFFLVFFLTRPAWCQRARWICFQFK